MSQEVGDHKLITRDLAVTTDFRTVLSEGVSRHLGNKNLNAVFPGFENQPDQFLRVLG